MSDSTQTSASKVQKVRDQIEDEDPDLISNADGSGVDTDSIIANHVQEYDSYGVETVARLAGTAIERNVEAEMAETVKGILMGCRDRTDNNGPRRWSLVKSDGDHMEFSTWDGTLPDESGDEVALPSGSGVELKVNYQEQYESYEGAQIVGGRDMDSSELVTNLERVAIPPSSLSAQDEYETVVVKGTIRYVNPQTVFAGDSQEDWYDGDVLMEDERGELQPHFELSFERDDDTSFRAHATQQRYGKPFWQVPDLEPLCRDAYEKYEQPNKQTQMLADVFRDREVIVVGNVNKYERDRQDGEPVVYVDLEISGMVSTDVTTLDDFDAADDAEAEPEGGEHVCPGCGKDDFDSAQALNGHLSSCDEYESEEEDDDPDESRVAEVRENIERYCEIAGEDFEDITVEDVNSKMGGIEAEDTVIRAALSGASGGGGDGDDEFDALLEAGTYNCPTGECLASASSISELAGHAQSDHDLSGYDDPKDFLRDEMEA